jgi:flagellar basal-body rod protein FlgB
MPISFVPTAGIHETALRLHGQRASVLANNLANSDTPNYKARDLDFKTILNQTDTENRLAIQTTNEHHISTDAIADEPNELLYRTPQQPSIDGNTVEDQIENAEYMKNALALQASFEFVNDEYKGLKAVFRGD